MLSHLTQLDIEDNAPELAAALGDALAGIEARTLPRLLLLLLFPPPSPRLPLRGAR